VPKVAEQEEVPSQVATVVPTGAGHTQAIVKSLEDSIAEIKTNVRELNSNRHTDFVYLITLFGAGFLLLAGILTAGYFRHDDKIEKLSHSNVRIETKLEDLLQRIPPTVVPAPKR
jgi:pheromone shutdown protein TraB